MSGLYKTFEGFVLLAALAAGGLALWNRRDKVRETWDSFGGVEGIANTANKLMESAGPAREFVNRFSHLK